MDENNSNKDKVEQDLAPVDNAQKKESQTTPEQDKADMTLKSPIYAKDALQRNRNLTGIKSVGATRLEVKSLPESIRKRREELEREFEREGLVERKDNQCSDKLSSGETENDLIFKKAKARVNKLGEERQDILGKISRNFKILIVVIIAFVGYYYINNVGTFSFLKQDPLKEVQAQLPLKLDPMTTLKEVSLQQDVFTRGVEKSNDAFSGEESKGKALKMYLESASVNFCKIKFFSDMIESGKKIKILIAAEGSKEQLEQIVDKCSY